MRILKARESLPRLNGRRLGLLSGWIFGLFACGFANAGELPTMSRSHLCQHVFLESQKISSIFNKKSHDTLLRNHHVSFEVRQETFFNELMMSLDKIRLIEFFSKSEQEILAKEIESWRSRENVNLARRVMDFEDAKESILEGDQTVEEKNDQIRKLRSILMPSAERLAGKDPLQTAVRYRFSRDLVDNLGIVIHQARVDLVPYFKALGVDVNGRSAMTGKTLLASAILDGNFALADRLLEVGANINHGKNQRKPLHEAAAANNHKGILYILRKGGKVDARDDKGNTPLMLAVINRSWSSIITLIDHHADINARNHSGQTPLHQAAWTDARLTRFLLENGANTSLNIGDKEGFTPLHFAAIGGRTDIETILLDAGADPKAQTIDGRTYLYFSTPEIRRMLLPLRED